MFHSIFEIKYETGRRERVEIDAPRILLGSGAHCDIRLAPEIGEWEHVVLTVEGDTLVARLLARGGGAIVDGAPLQEAALVDGSRLAIGAFEVVFRRAVGALEQKPKRSTPRFAVLLGLLFVPAVTFVAVQARRVESFAPPAETPSPLGEVKKACPAETRDRALVLAKEKIANGHAKRQRWKFHTRDGVDAVVSFEIASACFAAGGDGASATAAGDLAASLRAAVLHEYRIHRIKLERALEGGNAEAALAFVKLQREMLYTRDIEDPYVRWLTIMQRKLEAHLSQG
ncbi:MAG: hypothetical protein KF819_29720 [Labilithrix sp.]|nr:hypothetical protein [Labilithrix sp.]